MYFGQGKVLVEEEESKTISSILLHIVHKYLVISRQPFPNHAKSFIRHVGKC